MVVANVSGIFRYIITEAPASIFWEMENHCEQKRTKAGAP